MSGWVSHPKPDPQLHSPKFGGTLTFLLFRVSSLMLSVLRYPCPCCQYPGKEEWSSFSGFLWMFPSVPILSNNLVASLKIEEKASLTLSHILSPGAEESWVWVYHQGFHQGQKGEAWMAEHPPHTSQLPTSQEFSTSTTKIGQKRSVHANHLFRTHCSSSNRSESCNGLK